MHSELIQSDDAYASLRTEYACVFRDGERFPGMVFRDAMTHFSFFDYTQTLGKQFPAALSALSREYQDVTVNYLTLKPDAVDYYKKLCGFFGLASFRVDVLLERFSSVMSRDWATADSFMARGGDIGVYWGSSLKWCIYCDREFWDLCVLGSSAPIDKGILESLGVFEPHSLGNVLLAQNKHRIEEAKEFVAKLATNYRISNC